MVGRPRAKLSNVVAFEWVYRMADGSCHAGFVLFHGSWVVAVLFLVIVLRMGLSV